MIKNTINPSDFKLKLLAAAFLSFLALLTFASPAKAKSGDIWIETLGSFYKSANNFPGGTRPIKICSYQMYSGYVLDSNGNVWHWAGSYPSKRANLVSFPGTGTPVDLNCGIDESLFNVRVVSSTGDLFELQVSGRRPCTQDCSWNPTKLNNNSLVDVVAMKGGLVLTKDKKLYTLNSSGSWVLSTDLSGIMVASPVDIGLARSGWGFASYPYVLDSNGNIYWRWPSSWVLGANNYPGAAPPIATDGGHVLDSGGYISSFNDMVHMNYVGSSFLRQPGLVDFDMIEGFMPPSTHWRHYYYVEGEPSPSVTLNVKVFYDKNSNGVRDAGEDFTSFDTGVATVALDGTIITPNATGDYATFISASPAAHFLGIDPSEADSWSETGCRFSDFKPCSFTLAGSYYNTSTFSVAQGGSLTVYLGITMPDFTISISPDPNTVNRGASVNYNVLLTSAAGFSGTVNLYHNNNDSNSGNDLNSSNITLTFLDPSGTSSCGNPGTYTPVSSVTLAAGGSKMVNLCVDTTASTLVSTYTITATGRFIAGDDPDIVHSDSAQLIVVVFSWIKTTGGDVGAKIGPIGPIQRDISGIPEFNADYLVISGGAIDTNFRSLKGWLIRSYTPPSGINIKPELKNNSIYDTLSAKLKPTGAALEDLEHLSGGVRTTAGNLSHGDLIFPSPPNTGGIYYAGGPAVVLVDGNLTFNAWFKEFNGSGNEVVFIVNGDVTINYGAHEIDGFFLFDGNFITLKNPSGPDETLTIRGGAIGAFEPGKKFDLQRKNANGGEPSELFIYQPKYLWLFRDLLGNPKVIFRDLAP